MNWKYVLKMAFRNISRNRARTILSATAILFAVMLVATLNSYVSGLMGNMTHNLFMFDTAHVKIMNIDYVKEEKLMPLDLNVWGYENGYKEVIEMTKGVNGVKQVMPRTKFFAYTRKNGKRVNLTGFALHPELEHPVNPLKEKIIKGKIFRKFAPGQYETVIGKGLVDELGVDVGDKITINTKNAQEGFGQMTFRISGIASYDVSMFDKNYFYIDLTTAARFLAMPDEVLELGIFIDNPNNAEKITEKINTILDTKEDNYLKAYAWQEQHDGQFGKFFDFYDIVMTVYFLIFVVLASTVIINTVMMIIFERMREIGTIAAMGMRGGRIVQLFFFEAVIISTIGSFFGIVFGGIISYVFSQVGIDIMKLTGGGISWQLSERVYFTFSAGILIKSFLFGIAVASICAFFPARRAARIEPVEAMRGVL